MRQFDGLGAVRLPAQPVHLAIGIFDGVHRGHQSLIARAMQAARASGGLAGVLTFWPHPSAVLRPASPVPMLMGPGQKRRVLGGLGLDFIIEQGFTPEFARTTAQEFVQLLKASVPALAAVYVGENFRFGRGRDGDVATFAAGAAGLGFAVHSMPRLEAGGAPISSSRIRELVAAGDITQANGLLGYPYFSEGVAQPGRQLGRTIGFPTLNLSWEPPLQPRHGVYVARVAGADGRFQPAVANYGLRPTVGTAEQPLLEVHVLGATALGQGDKLTVEWLRFLRPERKFPGVEELKKQLENDRADALAAHTDISGQGKPKSA